MNANGSEISIISVNSQDYISLVDIAKFKNAIEPKIWIDVTNAIRIVSKVGKYNRGTFAHSDITFEFVN